MQHSRIEPRSQGHIKSHADTSWAMAEFKGKKLMAYWGHLAACRLMPAKSSWSWLTVTSPALSSTTTTTTTTTHHPPPSPTHHLWGKYPNPTHPRSLTTMKHRVQVPHWQAGYVTGSENAKICEFSPEISSAQFRRIIIGAQDENPVGEPSMTKESKKSALKQSTEVTACTI